MNDQPIEMEFKCLVCKAVQEITRPEDTFKCRQCGSTDGKLHRFKLETAHIPRSPVAERREF